MSAYGLALLVCLLTCLGQLCQKQAAHHHTQTLQFRMLWLLGGFTLLGVALLLWLRVLQLLPVSSAYPMLSLSFVGVTLAAHLLFGEPLSLRHWGGITLIVLGIILMSHEL